VVDLFGGHQMMAVETRDGQNTGLTLCASWRGVTIALDESTYSMLHTELIQAAMLNDQLKAVLQLQELEKAKQP
jgi:hypothetical protein